MIVLVIGGSGSGKSAWAERLAVTLPGVARVYLATMQAADGEALRRVERHRAQRADKGFQTVEAAMDLAKVPLPEKAVVLVEDVPNWAANEMFGGGDTARMIPALQSLAQRARHLILVTGNVFADGVAYDETTMAYLKLLAEVNAAAAEMADAVVEVVCGLPVYVKGEIPCMC